MLPKDSAQKLTCSMHRHAPPGFVTRRHSPPHAITHLHAPSFLLLTSALGDIIIATSSAGVTCQLADVIVDQDVDLR